MTTEFGRARPTRSEYFGPVTGLLVDTALNEIPSRPLRYAGTAARGTY